MNAMALEGTKKKKKHQFFHDLLSPSLQEVEHHSITASGEQEKETLYLFDSNFHYVETHTKSQEKIKAKDKKHKKKQKSWEEAKEKIPSPFHYLETPAKSQEKMKIKAKKHKKKVKAKKHKKGKSQEKAKKRIFSPLKKKEKLVLCADTMNDPVYQKGKCLMESENNSRVSDQREAFVTPASSFPELLTRKSRKKEKRVCPSDCCDAVQEVFRGPKEKRFKRFQATPVSPSAEEQFCSPFFLAPFGGEEGGQKELSQRETGQWEELDYFRGSTKKGFKSKRKLRKGIPHVASSPEIKSCAGTESPWSWTPGMLDSEEELHLGDREANTPPQMRSDQGARSSSIDTQGLFITQQLSNSSLARHSPNPAVFKGRSSHSNTSSTLQFSQVSVRKETFENSCLLSSYSATLRNQVEYFPATQECGVQTDDFFSSLAVASSFRFKRKPIDCQEQPLDLSLPYRVRSGATNAEIFHSLEGAGHGIPMFPRCKLETSFEVLDGGSESLVGSQSLKSEDNKYIQLHLNSSYYFKLKGDPDATVSGTPLVKLRDPDVTVFGTPLGRLTLEKKEKKKIKANRLLI